MKRIVVIVLMMAACLGNAQAQLHLKANVQNNHLWRGMEVSDGIVHVSLQATHDLKLGNYTVPVYAKGMWNPQSNQSYFQIGAEIIRF